jgi:hypothetical protein
MQLVEQHLIRRTDPRFVVIDQAAFASKNLYNQAWSKRKQELVERQRRLAASLLWAGSPDALSSREALCLAGDRGRSLPLGKQQGL